MTLYLDVADAWSAELTLALLSLVGSVLAGAMVVLWLGRRYKQHPDPPARADLLASYRELLQEGKLSQEEFNSIARTLEESSQTTRPHDGPSESPTRDPKSR